MSSHAMVQTKENKDKHCQRPSSQQSYAGMKDKYFPIKQKLKEFNIRPALQET